MGLVKVRLVILKTQLGRTKTHRVNCQPISITKVGLKHQDFASLAQGIQTPILSSVRTCVVVVNIKKEKNKIQLSTDLVDNSYICIRLHFSL